MQTKQSNGSRMHHATTRNLKAFLDEFDQGLRKDEYLTPQEIADKLKTTRESIYYALKQKQLRAYRFAWGWRVTPADLREYLEARRTF